MELAIGWIAASIVVAIIAGSRQRNAAGWLLLSLLISPLLGLILVLCLPPPASEVMISRDDYFDGR